MGTVSTSGFIFINRNSTAYSPVILRPKEGQPQKIAIVIMMFVLFNTIYVHNQKESPPKSTWWSIVIFDDNGKWSEGLYGLFLT